MTYGAIPALWLFEHLLQGKRQPKITPAAKRS